MPVFPNGFTVQEALADQDAERCDVRVKAYELTLSIIANETGRPVELGFSLSAQELQQVAETDDVKFIKSLVAIANNIYRAEREVQQPLPAGADNPSTPRAQKQAKITRKMFAHSQTVPRDLEYSKTTPLRERFNDTMAIIAPTGSGKTIIEAALARCAGIGQPLSETDDRELRGMLATSEVRLVEQFTGKRGDDTFQRFLGNVGVTAYYGKLKNKRGPLVATTDKSAVKLDPREFDLAMVDEGHIGLGPQMQAYIGRIGIRCYLFTATPAYNELNDLRRRYRYIEEGTMSGYIKEGILNPTRLLTFTYDDDPEAMAAILAYHYMKAGRKVVVYGRAGTKDNPGGPSKRVAQLVNELAGEDTAKAVGSHNKQSDEDLEAFDQGAVRVVATSRMIREGANIKKLTVGIMIGPHFSILDLGQKSGRPGRLDEDGEISELIELVPRANKSKRPMVSLWQVYGLDHVISGTIIAPDVEDETDEESGKALLSTEWSGKSDEQRGLTDKVELKQRGTGVDLSGLPSHITDAMVVDKPLRAITLGERVEPPEGYVQSSVLAADLEVPIGILHLTLDKQGFSYEGIWMPSDDGFEYSRWYEPAALQYLEENPIPKEAGAVELIAEEVAELCGVSKDFFLKIAKQLGVEPQPRLGKTHVRAKCYNFEQIILISVAIEAIPIAEETDIPIVDLQQELTTAFVSNELGVYKRRNPVHGIKGWCQHISAQEADELRAAYHEIPFADKHHKSIADLAKMAGRTYGTFQNLMTEAEKETIIPMRSKGAAPAGHLRKDVYEPLLERVRRVKLPPYLLPFSAIEKIINASDPTIRSWLKNNSYSPKKLPIGIRRPVSCYPWKGVEALEEEFGCKQGIRKIYYDRLIHNPTDLDPERWQYTQEVQKRFIEEKFLALLPEPEAEPMSRIESTESLQASPQKEVIIDLDNLSANEGVLNVRGSKPTQAEQERRATEGVLPDVRRVDTPPSRASSKQHDNIAGIPIKAGIPRAPRQAEKKETKEIQIPPEYNVNLLEYLSEVGATSQLSIIKMLIRRESLPMLRQDKNGVLWAKEKTAFGLEEAIKKFPIAGQDVASAGQIAKRYEQFSITDRHIVWLAGSVVSSFEGRTATLRERRQDGMAGELCLHFNAFLAKTLHQKMDEIVQDALKLRTLLRFGKLE